ncbi:MAG: oxidoreductase [Solirubrobacteraceae bacterium]|nr:oxidoreductase [Solirubrobacteraceae bacterium]
MTAAAVPLTVAVAGIEEPTSDVRTLRLVSATSAPLSPFAPGSNIEVQCGERRNAYSLIGDPRDTSQYAISVLRVADGSGGSRFLHDEVRRGDLLTISPPKSAFAPPAAARHHLLIAAGIGVTPFLSYARAFARTGASYELHYVHRARQDPHAGLLGLPGAAVRRYVGRESLAASLPELLDAAGVGTHLSVCGPPAMIDEVLDLARTRGWPEHRLHSERFVGVEAPAGEPFTARLARSGQTIAIPSGTSLLDAVRGAGVDLPYLCRQGVCGECKVRVLAGTPAHHDLHLTSAQKAAGDLVMACVSRCEGDELELDL